MANSRVWALLGAIAPTLTWGCYVGVDGSPGEGVASSSAGGASAGAADDGGAPEDDGGPGDGGEEGGDDGPVDAGCEEALRPTTALRFLTKVEYENTVRDLFGQPMDVTTAFGADEAVGGYAANSGQAPSSTQLELFLSTAETLAAAAATDHFGQFVACQPADPGCGPTFVEEFGRRAFRRRLTDVELSAYVADFDAIAADHSPALAVEVVATAMLASPHFLYVGDRGESTEPHARAYDLASRLSYFVWATMPDETLLDAAESGELSSADGVEAQVRRMLEDDKAADMLRSFSSQWLEVDELGARAPKHPDDFPDWSPALAEAAEHETAAMMEDIVLAGDGRFESLLTSRRAYVDDALASLYGVQAPAGEPGWVELPPGERGGVLTRVAFLARHSHATENSWVHRGKVVRERLLCESLPPPPPVADDSPINDDSRLNDPACAACHVLMDPIGVGFEQYDPIGRFTPGSAPGEVVGLDEPAFDGALELSARLAQSDRARGCFATQLYRFAHRRAHEDADLCSVDAVSQLFDETDGDIVELIVALATSATFTGLEGA